MQLTMARSAMGTPAYMPPEQAEGKIDQIDERSDIYSLGGILYEVLTLQRPIEGESSLTVLANVTQGPVISSEKRAPERRVPRELAAIVRKCMARQKEACDAESVQRQKAEQREQTVRRYLDGTQMKLVQQAWDAGDVPAVLRLLAAVRPQPGQEDVRIFARLRNTGLRRH